MFYIDCRKTALQTAKR